MVLRKVLLTVFAASVLVFGTIGSASAQEYICAQVWRVDENCKPVNPDLENDSKDLCLRDNIEACLRGRLSDLEQELSDCNASDSAALLACEGDLEKSRKRIRKLKQQVK